MEHSLTASARIPLPAFMLTAPGREHILAGTLERWTSAGGGPLPVIHEDPTPRTAHGLNRIMGGWRSLLERAVGEPASHVLLFEDDLGFEDSFREKMESWPPLRDGRLCAFGSFFNPGVPALTQADDWFLADPAGVLGSQALVVAREFVRGVLDQWQHLDGFPVMKMAALAARQSLPIYYHRPSLVEHFGTVSAWGGHLRRAVDFAPPSR